MSELNFVEETYARLEAGEKDAIMDALMLIMQKNHGTYLATSERIQERAKEIRKMRHYDL